MNNYLIHYGVPGQKWGVRRYQNADGTYTELGKQRLRGELGKATKARAKILREQIASQHRHEDILLRRFDDPNDTFIEDFTISELQEMKRDTIEIGKQRIQSFRHSEDFSRLSEAFPSRNRNYRDLDKMKERVRRFPGGVYVDYYDGKKHVAQFDVDNTKTIWSVHIDPEYRGCGLGSQLIKKAVDKFGGGSLLVLLDNEIAIHMYEDAGFKFEDDSFESEKYGAASGRMTLKRHSIPGQKR